VAETVQMIFPQARTEPTLLGSNPIRRRNNAAEAGSNSAPGPEGLCRERGDVSWPALLHGLPVVPPTTAGAARLCNPLPLLPRRSPGNYSGDRASSWVANLSSAAGTAGISTGRSGP